VARAVKSRAGPRPFGVRDQFATFPRKAHNRIEQKDRRVA
jgi:hypothetical protein